MPTVPKTKPPATKPPAKEPFAKSDEVFARWKAGARISELAKELKLSRPAIRRQIMLGAGSREAFTALRAKGAGGPPQGKGKGGS